MEGDEGGAGPSPRTRVEKANAPSDSATPPSASATGEDGALAPTANGNGSTHAAAREGGDAAEEGSSSASPLPAASAARAQANAASSSSPRVSVEDGEASAPLHMFPSAAAWHSSTAIAWGRDQTPSESAYIAYASKNVVRLVCPSTRAPLGTLVGHANRVSSVCLFTCTDASGPALHCASGSADRSVRLWNVRTRSFVAAQTFHKVEVTCVSASPCFPRGLVVSGDKEGKLVAWRVSEGPPKEAMVPVQGAGISCVLCSPSSENEVAVGLSSGIVAIVDIVQRSILKKMQHSDEVLSLTWSPPYVGDGAPSESPGANPALMLASTSRDKTIRIWNAEIGKLVMMLPVPKPSRPLTDAQKARIWISCAWSPHDRNLLVSSSQAGELLAWDLTCDHPSHSKFANGHSRSIFAIAFSPSRPSSCITVSLDRQIGMWEVPNRSLRWMLPGLGGYVYALDFSPASFAPCIAIGVGDGTVRLWHQNNSSDPYKSTLIWNGIQASKVTAIAWHPTKRGLLAIGTDEGNVGFADTTISTQNVKCIFMKARHRGTVYEVSWKPAAGSEDAQSNILSCGADGIVSLWNPERQDEKPVDLCSLISNHLEAQNKVTEFAVNTRGSKLAMGFMDGSVLVFLMQPAPGSPAPVSLAFVTKSKPHLQLVNRMRWSPSKDSQHLASASDDGTVVVSALDENSELKQLLKFSHLMPVSGLAWSANGVYIASGSFDGTSQVWNVADSSPAALIRGHEGRIFTVAWHSTDHQILFTGSEDQTVRSWNIMQHPFKTGGALKKKGKPKQPVQPPAAATVAQAADGQVAQTSYEDNLEGQPMASSVSTPEEKPSKPAQSSSTLMKPKKPRSLLPLNATALSSTSAGKEEAGGEPSMASTSHMLASLFEGGSGLDAMLEAEVRGHALKGTADAAATLEMWRGKPGSALATMAESGNMTASWLALAPLAGPEVWRALMHARANQLEEQGDVHQAVLHFLAAGDCIAAVSCYRKLEMYREAIALGRLREVDSGLLADLYAEWAVVLEIQGNQQVASKCKQAAENFSRQTGSGQ